MHYDDDKYVEILDIIIKSGLKLVPIGNDPSFIYVDLDSVLSILFSDDLPDDKDKLLLIIKNTASAIASFVDAWKNETTLKMYYSFKPTKKFNEYIPEWNENRNKRYNDRSVNIVIKNIINRLSKISLSNFKVIECPDSPILNIARDVLYETDKGSDALIISRDPHYQCLFSFLKDVEIYDGTIQYGRPDLATIKKFPKCHPIMIPYYYTLRGMDRNDYKGLPKWGPLKTISYVNTHSKSLLEGNDAILESKEIANALKVFKIRELI